MLVWLVNVYVDGVVNKVNVRVLGSSLSLVSVDCRKWNMSQAVCC